MGLRKYKRQIAKERMKCMGVKSSMLGSGIMPKRNTLRKKMKCRHGRAYLDQLRAEKPARWRRVTTGDLAKEGLRAQLLEGQRIKRRQITADVMKKRKIRKIRPATN